LEHAAAHSLSRSVGIDTDAAVAEAQEAARAAEERAIEAEAVTLQLQGLLSDQRSEIKSLQVQLQEKEQRLAKAVAAAEAAEAGLSAGRNAAEEAASLRAALHVVQEQLEGVRAEAAGLRSSLEDATVSVERGSLVAALAATVDVRAHGPHLQQVL
jgi:predicted  nucleic acid-binding Zn-ribbon protein